MAGIWRFLADATPGSRESADKRRVQVLIPPGQERRLFAARPELRIPCAAPMTYVDDPTPATVPCWYDEDENGPGYYSGQYSSPRPVLNAWGRTPAQADAEAWAKANLDEKRPWLELEAAWGNAASRARAQFLLQQSRPRFPSPCGVAA